MADHSDRPDDDWGEVTARWTFIATVVLALLYVGAVFGFILPR